ncbi:OLC1v1001586C1 [Oldenlandia corymbosa var. corymbosa]|uniref:glucan endo-1,3-beta-D-glucosidase n=1 Tax=Oldenlandia corymbosa var. corymbosa TaxID=529605 RepID=A0AAV1D8I0_OLDCO|nr:OLC1v1001586C1 [Oldenlandia corymbosa var. corymbosa]
MELYQPFLFPATHSAVLPDPSQYFAPNLLSSPLPTNSFFQNFVLKNGSQPEYIHPYIIKSVLSTLSICYPSLFQNASFVYQVFTPDLSISTVNNPNPNSSHVISAFSDLGVTLDHPSSKLRFYLVRGSPYVTFEVLDKVAISISTFHSILKISSNPSLTKYTIKLKSNQTWLLYASSPIYLKQSGRSNIITGKFTGVIRTAALPDSDPVTEATLDRFHSSYASSGHAVLSKPFTVEYSWEKKGFGGDLLMLALPLHLKFLSTADCSFTVLKNFKYSSIDGDLVGVVAKDSWVLKTDPIPLSWHSIKGVEKKSQAEIVAALTKDVKDLSKTPIGTNSSYFYGKAIARAARLALIAEEVSYLKVIPAIKKFLKRSIEPWLDGKFVGNAFLYDPKWGGIVTKVGSLDPMGDFGFGIYNDHHYHLGYFTYVISVLAKIDPDWGKKYKPQAYSLVTDFMTSSNKAANSSYPKVRCFDFWLLHSWAAGLTEFPDGRNQESTSEAINGYYSAALMGLAYGDNHLVDIGSTLTAFEIQSAIAWWHVRKDDTLYGEEFTKENRVVGILWANKRESRLWFAPPEWVECRLGIQVLPLLPITEVVFSDVKYTKQLVKWSRPALSRNDTGEGWKGFIFALEGVYKRRSALKKIKKLKGYDDGNSLTNLLWWIHSRS